MWSISCSLSYKRASFSVREARIQKVDGFPRSVTRVDPTETVSSGMKPVIISYQRPSHLDEP
jgi:hypothetical protein